MGLLVNVSKKPIDEIEMFLNIAAETIIEGKIIAFPTDSVYGLGCDPTNMNAVNRLFQIKFRDHSKGFLLLVFNIQEAEKIVIFNEAARTLAEHYWPGELSLILKRHPQSIIPPEVSASKETIGLRVPKNEIIRQILNKLIEREAFGGIVGTSANYAGEPPCTSGKEISNKFLSPIDLIIDSGKSSSGTATTIIDCTDPEIKIIREGKIKEEEILQLLA
ncbi:MAG: threonylcarbamoyl-AMP synthase [Promethearchaeota archaeon]|nr:MAG: threonylcarbamoyl-AMP synthase [Candidatus Lokiarchaeota archaeon]